MRVNVLELIQPAMKLFRSAIQDNSLFSDSNNTDVNDGMILHALNYIALRSLFMRCYHWPLLLWLYRAKVCQLLTELHAKTVPLCLLSRADH